MPDDTDTRCHVCLAPCRKQSGCARCRTPYCSRACQKAAWQFVHKQICPFVGGADRRAAEAAAAAEAACKSDVVRGATCYICLAEGPGLVRGCACRGDAGYAHVKCLIRAEAEGVAPQPGQCPTCRQFYHGAVRLAVAWGTWRARSREATGLHITAAGQLAKALHECDQNDDALVLMRCNIKMLEKLVETLRETHAAAGDIADRELAVLKDQSNLTNILSSLGKQEEAYSLTRQIFTQFKRLRGLEDYNTLTTALNLANHLKHQRKYREARDLLEETVPIMRKVLGSHHCTISSIVTLADVMMACECVVPEDITERKPQAVSLETSRAAAKLYDEAYASSRRLFGDDHPETRDNRWRAEGLRKMFEEQGISLEPEAPHPT